MLISLDRCSENVRVLPVVVTELELGDVERHVFTAHFVERADNAALEDRPEAFDGLSMDCADDVLASSMVHSGVRIFAVKTLVTGPLVCAEQTAFVRDRFSDKRCESVRANVCNNTGTDISLTTDSADDWSFAGTDAARSAAPAALIPMPIFGQAADESFIDFNDAAKLSYVFHERDADTVTHIPSCFQRTKTHIAPNLPRAHTLLTCEH